MSGECGNAAPKVARIFGVLVGLASIGWGGITLWILWQQSTPQQLASYIIKGESFKIEMLKAQVPILAAVEHAKYCYPIAMQSAAIIRLRIAEEALAIGERDTIAHDLDDLESSIRRSLSCSPTDSFLWLAFSWVKRLRGNSNSGELIYLRMSYQLGPNEGWIGLRRVPLAFSAFGQLPVDVIDHAFNEFLALVTSGLHVQAAKIFDDADSRVREQILLRLVAISHGQREVFAKALRARGRDVSFPDMQRDDARPWN